MDQLAGLKLYFRLKSAAGRMCFLQHGWRSDHPTKFGPSPVSNV